MFDSRHRKCLQRIPQCISAGTSQKSSAKSFLYCHIILLLSPGPHKKARRNTPLPVFRENKSSCTPSGQKLYHHIPFIGSSAAPFQLYLLYHRFSHHICDLFAICRKKSPYPPQSGHFTEQMPFRKKASILRPASGEERAPPEKISGAASYGETPSSPGKLLPLRREKPGAGASAPKSATLPGQPAAYPAHMHKKQFR